MALLKKNIWLIYYIVFVVGALFFLLYSYMTWQTIFNKHKAEQENLTSMFTNSMHNLLSSQEVMLDVLGQRFVEDSNYQNTIKVAQVLNKLRERTPSLLAFGVTDPNGNYTFLSSHKDVFWLPNIKEINETKDSFLQTLSSHNMVLGRTYYFPPLEAWLFPIRKAIRDENGTVKAVMTAGFDTQKTFQDLGKGQDEKYTLSVIRGDDYYRLYSPLKNNPAELYGHPVSKKILNTIIQNVEKEYHLSLSHIQEEEKVISYVDLNLNAVKMLFSFKYNKTYNLWFGVQTPFSDITTRFYQTLAVYCIVFGSVMVGFYFLFSMVAKSEAKKRQELLYQATHDALTLLPNRAYLQTIFRGWTTENVAREFTLFYIDLDHFKHINDGFGHQYGDAILIEVARRLKNVFSETSTIIRYGGDEFIVLTEINDTATILEIAHSAINALCTPYRINTLDFTISASIGIAKYPEHANNYGHTIQAADIAMYEAKKSRNCSCIFDDMMQENYLNSVRIENELHQAIEKNEFFMVYQPQIDQKGDCYGVESLIRWNNSQLGSVPPNIFIPIAESCGLMPKIGRYIIETVLEDIRAIQSQVGFTFQTSVNVSVSQFLEHHFFNHLTEMSKKYAIDNVSITLEVTETLVIEDLNHILPLMLKIKELGMKISMDDFGTGYSSLSMLRKLPIDELKIDKSFVDDILKDKYAKTMIQSIIDIGKNFNMKLLAEGVETKEQYELLTSLNCDLFQGYYFSKPLTKESLCDFLNISRCGG